MREYWKEDSLEWFKRYGFWIVFVMILIAVWILSSRRDGKLERKKISANEFIDSFIEANQLTEYRYYYPYCQQSTYELKHISDTSILLFEAKCLDVIQTDSNTIAIFIPTQGLFDVYCEESAIVCKINCSPIAILDHLRKDTPLLIAVKVEKITSKVMNEVAFHSTPDGKEEYLEILLKKVFHGNLLAFSDLTFTPNKNE